MNDEIQLSMSVLARQPRTLQLMSSRSASHHENLYSYTSLIESRGHEAVASLAVAVRQAEAQAAAAGRAAAIDARPPSALDPRSEEEFFEDASLAVTPSNSSPPNSSRDDPNVEYENVVESIGRCGACAALQHPEDAPFPKFQTPAHRQKQQHIKSKRQQKRPTPYGTERAKAAHRKHANRLRQHRLKEALTKSRRVDLKTRPQVDSLIFRGSGQYVSGAEQEQGQTCDHTDEHKKQTLSPSEREPSSEAKPIPAVVATHPASTQFPTDGVIALMEKTFDDIPALPQIPIEHVLDVNSAVSSALEAPGVAEKETENARPSPELPSDRESQEQSQPQARVPVEVGVSVSAPHTPTHATTSTPSDPGWSRIRQVEPLAIAAALRCPEPPPKTPPPFATSLRSYSPQMQRRTRANTQRAVARPVGASSHINNKVSNSKFSALANAWRRASDALEVTALVREQQQQRQTRRRQAQEQKTANQPQHKNRNRNRNRHRVESLPYLPTKSLVLDHNTREVNQLAWRPCSPFTERQRYATARAQRRAQRKKETENSGTQIYRRSGCASEKKEEADARGGENVMLAFASGPEVPISTLLGDCENKSQPQIQPQQLKRPAPSPAEALRMLVPPTLPPFLPTGASAAQVGPSTGLRLVAEWRGWLQKQQLWRGWLASESRMLGQVSLNLDVVFGVVEEMGTQQLETSFEHVGAHTNSETGEQLQQREEHLQRVRSNAQQSDAILEYEYHYHDPPLLLRSLIAALQPHWRQRQQLHKLSQRRRQCRTNLPQTAQHVGTAAAGGNRASDGAVSYEYTMEASQRRIGKELQKFDSAAIGRTKPNGDNPDKSKSMQRQWVGTVAGKGTMAGPTAVFGQVIGADDIKRTNCDVTRDRNELVPSEDEQAWRVQLHSHDAGTAFAVAGQGITFGAAAGVIDQKRRTQLQLHLLWEAWHGYGCHPDGRNDGAWEGTVFKLVVLQQLLDKCRAKQALLALRLAARRYQMLAVMIDEKPVMERLLKAGARNIWVRTTCEWGSGSRSSGVNALQAVAQEAAMPALHQGLPSPKRIVPLEQEGTDESPNVEGKTDIKGAAFEEDISAAVSKPTKLELLKTQLYLGLPYRRQRFVVCQCWYALVSTVVRGKWANEAAAEWYLHGRVLPQPLTMPSEITHECERNDARRRHRIILTSTAAEYQSVRYKGQLGIVFELCLCAWRLWVQVKVVSRGRYAYACQYHRRRLLQRLLSFWRAAVAFARTAKIVRAIGTFRWCVLLASNGMILQVWAGAGEWRRFRVLQFVLKRWRDGVRNGDIGCGVREGRVVMCTCRCGSAGYGGWMWQEVRGSGDDSDSGSDDSSSSTSSTTSELRLSFRKGTGRWVQHCVCRDVLLAMRAVRRQARWESQAHKTGERQTLQVEKVLERRRQSLQHLLLKGYVECDPIADDEGKDATSESKADNKEAHCEFVDSKKRDDQASHSDSSASASVLPFQLAICNRLPCSDCTDREAGCSKVPAPRLPATLVRQLCRRMCAAQTMLESLRVRTRTSLSSELVELRLAAPPLAVTSPVSVLSTLRAEMTAAAEGGTSRIQRLGVEWVDEAWEGCACSPEEMAAVEQDLEDAERGDESAEEVKWLQPEKEQQDQQQQQELESEQQKFEQEHEAWERGREARFWQVLQPERDGGEGGGKMLRKAGREVGIADSSMFVDKITSTPPHIHRNVRAPPPPAFSEPDAGFSATRAYATHQNYATISDHNHKQRVDHVEHRSLLLRLKQLLVAAGVSARTVQAGTGDDTDHSFYYRGCELRALL